MAPIVDDLSFGVPAFARCEECDAALAHDQRYCVVCGARRGALPAAAATIIGGGPSAALADGAATAPALPAPVPWFPTARVAAVAVLAVLGFGVVVGSAVRPLPTGTRASLAFVAPAAAAPAPAPAPVAPVEIPASAPPDAGFSDDSTAGGSGGGGGSQAGSRSTTPAKASTLPDVKHVFLVVLSGHGFDQAFGDASPAPYLAKTLTGRGELLANYYGAAQGELANGIALISGQGPTVQTAGNCPTYTEITPARIRKDGQVEGDGCVYPARATTIGDQLTAKNQAWKAYVEDLATGRPPDASDCRHPALGAPDAENAPRPQDPHTTWRDPFVYFHSIIDGEQCDDGLADLSALKTDLASSAGAPALAYIVANRCHDGSDTVCEPGQPTGLAAADDFLRKVVPVIEASAAYKDGGLIAITFDQAPQTGPNADASSCCNAPLFPNLPDASAPPPAAAAARVDEPRAAIEPEPPVITEAQVEPAVATPVTPPEPAPAAAAAPPAVGAPPSPAPPAPAARGADGQPVGGGKVGLLLISSFVKAGTVNRVETFNHFSLLRSIEDLFGLDHLGYAADPSLLAFDKAIYNAAAKPSPAATG